MARSKRVMDDMLYRSAPILTDTVVEQERAVEAIAATEAPVLMPDHERREMVPEVLLMSGAKMPKDRSVPLLDNHRRESSKDIVGSATELRVEDGQLKCRNVFSETASDTFKKVQEKHLKDVSIGYEVEKKVFVPRGKSEHIAGRRFEGPVNVVTSWRVRELSVTPMGRDEQAKMRGIPFFNEELSMKKVTKAILATRGMPADLDDAKAFDWLKARGCPADCQDLDAWVEENIDALKGDTANTNKTAESRADDETSFNGKTIDVNAIAARAAEEAVKRVREEEQARAAAYQSHLGEVRGICELVGLSDRADTLAQQYRTMGEVRDAIKKIQQERSVNVPFSFNSRIEYGAEQRDKHLGAVRSAILTRAIGTAFSGSAAVVDRVVPVASRAAGYQDYMDASLSDLARACLEIDGFNIRGLSREQIAMAAFGFSRHVGALSMRASPAYHTTSSFLQLTLDASNKTLLASYQEYPMTWRQCFRQAASVPDFKQIHRIRDGASPNLHHLPDNAKPEVISFADEKESYSVESYSNQTSFSYRLVINDDMDALTRLPMKFGAAAARTQNAKVWAVITDNAALSDGQALFLETPAGNRKRKNLTTGAGAPSVSTVQTLTNLMMQMRGLNTPEGNESEDILGLMPKYIVGPSALRTTILQLVRSVADPAQTNSITYNTANGLVPVIEPLLDAATNGTTAWYLICDQSACDTVELAYLQGQEQPQTRNWQDDETLSQHFAILQTFGVKAIDHRGMQKHQGA